MLHMQPEQSYNTMTVMMLKLINGTCSSIIFRYIKEDVVRHPTSETVDGHFPFLVVAVFSRKTTTVVSDKRAE